VEHVLDRFDLSRSGRNLRLAKRAVQKATRTFATWSDWKRLAKIHTFRTSAADEATATYTESTRTVTRSSGAWPAWAGDGQIKIGSHRYQCESRSSDTDLIIRSEFTPGANVASGAVELTRNLYLLPTDCHGLSELLDNTCETRLDYASDADTHAWSVLDDMGTGKPHTYSVVGHPNYARRLAIRLAPGPQTERIYSAAYQSRATAMELELEQAGTVSIAAGSTAVVGAGTAFTSKMVNAVIRLGTATAHPGPLYGGIDETDVLAAQEFTVVAVTDATHLTVHAAALASHTNVKYTISDRLDADLTAMLDAFFPLCEYEFARLAGRQDSSQLYAVFREELDRAKAADSRVKAMQTPVNFGREYSRIGDVEGAPE
jgi:hypothetical protein